MKVLVTGGLGYIGSHVIVELSAKGHEIAIVDNLTGSNLNVLKHLSELTKNWTFYRIDVRDRHRMREMFDKEQPEAVIHLAGLKAVAESVDEPLAYYDDNFGGAMVLCEVMAEKGVKKLVFSSSACVYGSAPVPYKEFAETGRGLKNPYGRTKFMVEEMLQDVIRSDSKWQITSLRYFNPIGAHESGLLGDDQLKAPNNLMPYLLQVASGQREELTIFGSDYHESKDGTAVRDYLHVVDLAKGHVTALDRLKNSGTMEVYNLGRGQGVSVLELVRTFEKATGVKVPFKYASRRPGDLPAFWADTKKAERELDWRAVKTLEQACRDAWRWQTTNPEGYEPKSKSKKS